MKRAHLKIDLNCDMGELPEAIADGTQESLMPSLTSVNVACGGHAGDEQTMKTTIEQALRRKLAIGAHPGYADHANFGRWPRLLTVAARASFTSSRTGRFTIRQWVIAGLRKRLRKALLDGTAMPSW